MKYLFKAGSQNLIVTVKSVLTDWKTGFNFPNPNKQDDA